MVESCIFCRIAQGEIPATRLYESEHVLAFRDVNPQAPVHVLVIPKVHVSAVTQLPAADGTWNAMLAAVQHLAQQENLDTGFRLVMNQGPIGGQTVDHLHIHLLAGRQMRWPPG
jgi:histidine triad (HIT) family protein